MRNLPDLVLIAAALTLEVAASYPSPTIKRVVIVGGTHGNEYTGVWCIKALAHEDLKSQYPSLDISTVLGNPQAHLENKRFIHSDLNREFSEDKLASDKDRSASVESLRARELDELLGPKFGCADDYGIDLAIDLHTTTSNMGITVIIPEGDALMAQAAAHVMLTCGAKCLMHSIPKRKHRPNLSSAAKHGFTIEVGPVPQSILRHDIFEQTQMALKALLEFLEERNAGKDVLGQLKRMYPDEAVPCFRSAPAKLPGEMSGKLVWPSDPDNPNFPEFMVHKSIQDQDFKLIRKGDPLFVKLDGSVVNYEGSHGDEVYLIFVNEGGYYFQSSGTGIGVALAARFNLENGMIVELDAEEEIEDTFE